MLLRRSFAGLLAAAAAPPVLAHGSSDSHALSGGGPGDPSKVTRTVEFVATDNAFSHKTLRVRDGETLRIVVRNDGMDPHELTIATVAEHADHRGHMREMMERRKKDDHGHSMAAMEHRNGVWVDPGRTASFIWTFIRTPDLEFACNIPGHYEDGMKGAIAFVGGRS